jgi:hypothetical protein
MSNPENPNINLTATIFDAELRIRLYLIGQYRSVSEATTRLKEVPGSARYHRPNRGSCAVLSTRLSRAIKNRKAKISSVESRLNALLA